jgi:hypothetical protein
MYVACLCELLQVNPDALPAAPGPQFKVQLNAAAAAAGAGAAGGAAVTKAGGATAPAPAAAAAPAASKKTAGKPAASATKAAGAAAAGGPAAAGTYYIEHASHTQPPLLQSLKPAAGELGRTTAALCLPFVETVMLL